VGPEQGHRQVTGRSYLARLEQSSDRDSFSTVANGHQNSVHIAFVVVMCS
jgi:hypothetical protein